MVSGLWCAWGSAARATYKSLFTCCLGFMVCVRMEQAPSSHRSLSVQQLRKNVMDTVSQNAVKTPISQLLCGCVNFGRGSPGYPGGQHVKCGTPLDSRGKPVDAQKTFPVSGSGTMGS